MDDACVTSETIMYSGRPYAYRAYFCKATGEEYGMGWRPLHCPLCGRPLVVTDEREWDGITPWNKWCEKEGRI